MEAVSERRTGRHLQSVTTILEVFKRLLKWANDVTLTVLDIVPMISHRLEGGCCEKRGFGRGTAKKK